MKKLRFLILLPFLLLLFFIFGSRCNLGPEIENTNNNLITSVEVKKARPNDINTNVDIAYETGITLGTFKYTSGPFTREHFVVYDYELQFNLKTFNNEVYVDSIVYDSYLHITESFYSSNAYTYIYIHTDYQSFTWQISTSDVKVYLKNIFNFDINVYLDGIIYSDRPYLLDLGADILLSLYTGDLTYSSSNFISTTFEPDIEILNWSYKRPNDIYYSTIDDFQTIYNSGMLDGYIEGSQDGYNRAFELFESSEGVLNNMWSIMRGSITSVLTMLSLQIMPGVPLYIILIVPLVFGIIFFIWKGGTQ